MQEKTLKVKFEITEESWIGFTLDIPYAELKEFAPDIDLDDVEGYEWEITDFIFSNYSVQELIAMGADEKGNIELTIIDMEELGEDEDDDDEDDDEDDDDEIESPF